MRVLRTMHTIKFKLRRLVSKIYLIFSLNTLNCILKYVIDTIKVSLLTLYVLLLEGIVNMILKQIVHRVLKHLN